MKGMTMKRVLCNAVASSDDEVITIAVTGAGDHEGKTAEYRYPVSVGEDYAATNAIKCFVIENGGEA